MKTAFKAIGALLGAVVVLIAFVAGMYITRSGMLIDRGPEQTTACSAIDGQGKSGEDILIDRERGLALVSWRDRRTQSLGTIGRIDLNAPEPKIESALLADPPEFRPHGMSLFIGPDGQRILFAISHPTGKPHRVEIFEANADGLYEHKQTIEDPLLIRPNDLVAVGPRQFYVANDSGAKNGLDGMRETVFGAAFAQVTYFDGAKFSVALDGAASPGGIAVSADLATIYLAETQGKRISAFKRDATNGALSEIGTAPLPSLPDNIDVAADGSLWVVAHANAIALIRQFTDPTKVAPTQVFRIPADTMTARQVFFTTGNAISAGSIAATVGDKMLLGSITDKKVMLCQRPE
ncbi:MAG: SMP-30/gluconolactonase/LRE family protein [Rhodospirillaceae bacterium]|nr:SMP-30/gluconolactonase/LRE family protein [Rhodospirillaceae bacterium]